MNYEVEGVKVNIHHNFLSNNPTLKGRQLAEGLVKGSWMLPRLESGQWVAGMGTTAHKAMPTAFAPNGQDSMINIFAKPFNDHFLAEQEYKNTMIAFDRGLNVPPVVALIDFGDSQFLVSQLFHTAEPLSARNLTFKLNDPRVYNPHDFLVDTAISIADMHNRGIVHGDLHPGNMGHQFQLGLPPKIIFFDLETADILTDDQLRKKNQGYWQADSEVGRAKLFEGRAAVDLGTFLASIRFNGFPMRRKDILNEAADFYYPHRVVSLGFPNRMEFRQLLTSGYDDMYRQLRNNGHYQQ